jgi:hypothetical protein
MTVEALAEWSATLLLGYAKFRSVVVEIHKPSVFNHSEGPGVMIERFANDFTSGQETVLPDGWDTMLQFEAK